MEKVKIILPIHSALAPHVSTSGIVSVPVSVVDPNVHNTYKNYYMFWHSELLQQRRTDQPANLWFVHSYQLN